MEFPISRDPPEGGTVKRRSLHGCGIVRFQFLGIPPKGELAKAFADCVVQLAVFPISRDPPEGGTSTRQIWLSGRNNVSNF